MEEYGFWIEVHELSEGSVSTSSFIAREGFIRKEAGVRPWNGVLIEEPLFTIEAAILDHKTPSLAFSIREKFHININKDVLIKLGLPVGPWLNELKRCFRKEMAMDSEFVARFERAGGHEEKVFALGDFIENRLVIITRGQKVTYVADAAGNKVNIVKIVRLASNSDTFFCEAAFLDADSDKAVNKYHLTARDAGKIAREAGAQRLEIFHFSPKYRENPTELYEEAYQEFGKRQ